jgi:hypothetical protein
LRISHERSDARDLIANPFGPDYWQEKSAKIAGPGCPLTCLAQQPNVMAELGRDRPISIGSFISHRDRHHAHEPRS